MLSPLATTPQAGETKKNCGGDACIEKKISFELDLLVKASSLTYGNLRNWIELTDMLKVSSDPSSSEDKGVDMSISFL